MFIRVPVFFKLIITLTLFSSVALGQDGYESPVLDDEDFTQPFQRRINERNAAQQSVQQIPTGQNAPVKQPVPEKQKRGGLFDRGASANQSGKNNSAASAPKPVENDKNAKSSWWKFWEKKEKNPEPEMTPSNYPAPQQTNPRTTSNAPRYEQTAPRNEQPPRYDQPAPPAYQNPSSGNSSVNPPVSSTAQTQIRTATGTEMKPTAQADVQTQQYDWSQSRYDSMRAGNLPGQQPFLTYNGAKIVAKVENAVILESDVQAGVRKRIAKMQREAKKNGADPLTENELQREIQMWHVQVLQELVQHHVMFTRACASIPRENLENVKAAVDKAFDDKQLPVMIKEYGVASQWELEQALKAEGSCIEKEKKKFFEQSIGIQWLQMQADPVKEIRHDQIMEYYNSHIDQYTITPKARWEELVVFKFKFPSREEAYKAIQKMGQAVVAGKPFAEVAKQSSQGVTASDGGKRDWVSPGVLNSEPLNKAIFEQPVGELSPRILEDENCFYIVRVLERHGKRMIPFEEAQTEIRKKLTSEQEEANRRKAFEKVFSEAKVTIVGNEQSNEKPE
ncbi:MAG: peptidyl-prolyl cis-trans isomerase [Thermoguttaceae bacterium]|nr:peptidyl-prolyl cis-trans isomerase [Thermoguttaceae bacterium]